MEFKFRANDDQGSKHNRASSSIGYITEQALRAGYASTYSEHPNELFRNPSIVREVIQRELQKERIREEIIAAEKRVIEAEVRRDMLIEREMALRKAKGLSFLRGAPSSSSMLFEPTRSILHQFDGRSIGGFNTLPFQGNAEPKAKPLSEVGKERVIFVAKPDENLSGAKRKTVTPLAAASNECPSVSLKKKHKEEWSCAVCHVSATCERGLNEHFQGKKHKARAAGLGAGRTGKNFSIGLFPHKTGKAGNVMETSPCSEQQREKLERKSLQQVETSPLLKILNNEAAAERQKTYHKKKRFKFWCEMCQIGAFSAEVMETHRKGKKHLGRLQDLNRNGGSIPADLVAETSQKAKYVDVVTKDEGQEAMENVDGTADGAELENHYGVVEVAETTQEAKYVYVVAKDEGKEAMENVDGTADGTELENHPGVVEVASGCFIDYSVLPFSWGKY